MCVNECMVNKGTSLLTKKCKNNHISWVEKLYGSWLICVSLGKILVVEKHMRGVGQGKSEQDQGWRMALTGNPHPNLPITSSPQVCKQAL